eukprot:CAMPEP_0206452198 /NCGR_PEP_ID=MMETSP0324_2-20121206/19809_1 /ASSEMBLY_ACC=CAM_ASM_000836 /TAXON_ID=2866 /ORGANISM="Crypthecodinium cohnii, Strain Seligo" /LENGTH=59 /DNA_ID=CAMNT_0053922255 /DNA_START=338 /DNA_END=517 /DNA_ORIENTATION=+
MDLQQTAITETGEEEESRGNSATAESSTLAPSTQVRKTEVQRAGTLTQLRQVMGMEKEQ